MDDLPPAGIQDLARKVLRLADDEGEGGADDGLPAFLGNVDQPAPHDLEPDRVGLDPGHRVLERGYRSPRRPGMARCRQARVRRFNPSSTVRVQASGTTVGRPRVPRRSRVPPPRQPTRHRIPVVDRNVGEGPAPRQPRPGAGPLMARLPAPLRPAPRSTAGRRSPAQSPARSSTRSPGAPRSAPVPVSRADSAGTGPGARHPPAQHLDLRSLRRGGHSGAGTRP